MKTEITAILEMMAEYMKRVSDTSTNYEQLIESFSQRLNVHTSHSQITNDLGNLLTDLASMTLHQDWSPLGWLWRQEVVVWGATCDICRTPDTRKWTLKGSWGHLYTVDYVHHYSVGALNHSTLKSPLIGNRNKFLFCQMTPSLRPPDLTRQIRGGGKTKYQSWRYFYEYRTHREMREESKPPDRCESRQYFSGRVCY